jgi:hypothetical protein
MNSLTDIKAKVAVDNKFPDWDSYNSMFPNESWEKLAKECWKQGAKESRTLWTGVRYGFSEYTGTVMGGLPQLED